MIKAIFVDFSGTLVEEDDKIITSEDALFYKLNKKKGNYENIICIGSGRNIAQK